MGSTPMNAATAARPRRRIVWALGPVLVLSALGVRQYLRSSQAGAAPGVASAQSRAHATAPAAGSAAGVRPAPRRERVTVDWPVVVNRDPFRSDRVYPPAPKQQPRVDPPPQRPGHAQLLQEAKANLRFTAVVLGDAPKAMVNGRLYRVGSVVSGYRVVEITGRQLTLEKDGTRLQLTCE